MKKTIAILLAIILCAALVTACGQTPVSPESSLPLADISDTTTTEGTTTTEETTTTTESGSDTTTTITTETLKGDVNSDTKVDIVDLVRMARYICQDADITPLSAQEITNADIDENDLIDADDISMLAQYLANILEF